MNTIANTIIKETNAIVNKNELLYKKRLDRVTAAYCEENEDIKPTLDLKGRFHAPCNGYRIPDRILNSCDFSDCYDEKLFSKGEYLPNPLDMDEFNFFSNSNYKNFLFKTRFLAKGEILSIFEELTQQQDGMPFHISFGKSWLYENEKQCYVYIVATWKSIISLFNKTITDRQKEIKRSELADIEAKRILEKSLKGDFQEGKQTVKAIVKSIKSTIGYTGNTEYKMLVSLENGATSYGSIPKSIFDEIENGDSITFTATFECSKNDSTHGYHKRPSKAKILKNVTLNN